MNDTCELCKCEVDELINHYGYELCKICYGKDVKQDACEKCENQPSKFEGYGGYYCEKYVDGIENVIIKEKRPCEKCSCSKSEYFCKDIFLCIECYDTNYKILHSL